MDATTRVRSSRAGVARAHRPYARRCLPGRRAAMPTGSTAPSTERATPLSIALKHRTRVSATTKTRALSKSATPSSAAACSMTIPVTTETRARATVASVTACMPCSSSSIARQRCRQRLVIKEGANDKLTWKFTHGGSTTQAEFADPATNATYMFCVFAGTANASVASANLRLTPHIGKRRPGLSYRGQRGRWWMESRVKLLAQRCRRHQDHPEERVRH